MTDAPSSSRAHDLTDGDAEREWPLLVRATDGKGKKDTKVKISTTVRPSIYPCKSGAYRPPPTAPEPLAADHRPHHVSHPSIFPTGRPRRHRSLPLRLLDPPAIHLLGRAPPETEKGRPRAATRGETRAATSSEEGRCDGRRGGNGNRDWRSEEGTGDDDGYGRAAGRGLRAAVAQGRRTAAGQRRAEAETTRQAEGKGGRADKGVQGTSDRRMKTAWNSRAYPLSLAYHAHSGEQLRDCICKGRTVLAVSQGAGNSGEAAPRYSGRPR